MSQPIHRRRHSEWKSPLSRLMSNTHTKELSRLALQNCQHQELDHGAKLFFMCAAPTERLLSLYACRWRAKAGLRHMDDSEKTNSQLPPVRRVGVERIVGQYDIGTGVCT